MLTGHTEHTRFKAIVSRKPGTRYRNVLGEIFSRKPGTRHTDVLGQLCHLSQARDTETFGGNIVTYIWHTAKRRFKAIVSCEPVTRYRDI